MGDLGTPHGAWSWWNQKRFSSPTTPSFLSFSSLFSLRDHSSDSSCAFPYTCHCGRISCPGPSSLFLRVHCFLLLITPSPPPLVDSKKMKFILAPLMAIGVFAVSFVAAADVGQKQQQQQKQQSFQAASKTSPELPVGTVYAYWPDKKEGEDRRTITIEGDNGSKGLYVAVFKDPKTNKWDLSTKDGILDAMAKEPPMSAESFDPYALDNQVLFSVYLDQKNNIIYSIPGTNVPTSWKDVKNVNDALAEVVISRLDPNTPGIEDIKDPNAAMAQLMLNNIAMKGPGALEAAKNNPMLVNALDAAYEASKNWDKDMAALDAKVQQEEHQGK